MIKGGYVMVDFSGVDLSITTKQTITGITEKVVNAFNTNKIVFVENCVMGSGKKVTPLVMSIYKDGANYKVLIDDKVGTVTANNEITFTGA